MLPCSAVDVAPPGLFSCKEQKAWGACLALQGTGFCAVSCGACTPNATNTPCDDVPTPDGTPCAEVRWLGWGGLREWNRERTNGEAGGQRGANQESC